jgi:hypothetical protein
MGVVMVEEADIFTMKRSKIKRLQMIEKVFAQNIKQKVADDILGITERQVRRLVFCQLIPFLNLPKQVSYLFVFPYSSDKLFQVSLRFFKIILPPTKSEVSSLSQAKRRTVGG